MSSMPARHASSTTYWIAGLSTTGSISFGCALVAGRNLVPRPAAGMTAFLTFMRALSRVGAEAYRREACVPPSRNPSAPAPHVSSEAWRSQRRSTRNGRDRGLGYDRCDAHVRVRLHQLRPTRRGLPADLRAASADVRRVWRSAPQGV